MENLGNYHSDTEGAYREDLAKGPAYLFGVAEQLDKELSELGR